MPKMGRTLQRGANRIAYLRTLAFIRRLRLDAGKFPPSIHDRAFMVTSEERAHMLALFPWAADVPSIVAALTDGTPQPRTRPAYPATLTQMRRRRVAADGVATWIRFTASATWFRFTSEYALNTETLEVRDPPLPSL
jgi:hypothetical protein